jgi:hypothetical protein
MAGRRERQMARTPGFTAVSNRRVNAAIDAATALIMLANAAAVAEGTAKPLNPAVAHDEALRQVARQLPRPAMVFDWRNGLPTRNDNPEYRK